MKRKNKGNIINIVKDKSKKPKDKAKMEICHELLRCQLVTS